MQFAPLWVIILCCDGQSRAKLHAPHLRKPKPHVIQRNIQPHACSQCDQYTKWRRTVHAACQIACLQCKWPVKLLACNASGPNGNSPNGISTQVRVHNVTFLFSRVLSFVNCNILTTLVQWSNPLLGSPVVPSSNPTWKNFFLLLLFDKF